MLPLLAPVPRILTDPDQLFPIGDRPTVGDHFGSRSPRDDTIAQVEAELPVRLANSDVAAADAGKFRGLAVLNRIALGAILFSPHASPT